MEIRCSNTNGNLTSVSVNERSLGRSFDACPAFPKRTKGSDMGQAHLIFCRVGDGKKLRTKRRLRWLYGQDNDLSSFSIGDGGRT